jgi:hypothetical protein
MSIYGTSIGMQHLSRSFQEGYERKHWESTIKLWHPKGFLQGSSAKED